ncbi:MAG: transglutaminase domain-containing protein [Myxococcota bacterium]
MLILTSTLFLVFPRVGLFSLGLLGRDRVGFPSEVSLAGTPRAQGGGATAARVYGLRYAQYAQGLYLRGPVYDQLTTDGFQHSLVPQDLPPSQQSLMPSDKLLRYEVFMQPLLGRLMLSLGPTSHVQILRGGQQNASLRTRLLGTGPTGETLASAPLTGALRYRVLGSLGIMAQTADFSTPKHDALVSAPLVVTHYTRLPETLDRRIPELAKQIVGGKIEVQQKATALRNYLQSRFEYTLEQPNGDKVDPLAAFLFEDRRGHCEYFATAFATLLRAVDIPSRVVGGYAGGLWDDEDDVVVFTAAHAHAWVEWFVPGQGWVIDDATPITSQARTRLMGFAIWLERARRFWDDHVVDYGIDQQMTVFQGAARLARSPTLQTQDKKRIAFGILGTLSLLGIWVLWRRRRRRIYVASHGLGQAIERTLERLTGRSVRSSHTLREEVRAALSQHDALKVHHDFLWHILDAYEGERFGSIHLSLRDRIELLRRLRRLRNTQTLQTRN